MLTFCHDTCRHENCRLWKDHHGNTDIEVLLWIYIYICIGTIGILDADINPLAEVLF